MKKFLVCMAVLFAFAITAAAQDTGASQSSMAKSKKSSMSSGSKSTTGCIEKSGDGYVLKNSKNKEGVKVTGSDDLAPHVGHTVKLTGSWTTPGQEFAETKLDMVSDTCKMGGGKAMSSTGKKKGAAAGSSATPPPSF